MSVFKVDDKFKVILNPDAVKLVPELSQLTEQELLYVILAVDYSDSPFRMKPLEERKILAARRAFKAEYSEAFESEKFITAMNAYKGLIFDMRRETLDMYKRKVMILQKELFREDLSNKQMMEIDKSINFLEDRIQNISSALDQAEKDNLQIKGQRQLSWLEKWQRNQKEYKKFLDEDD